MDLSLIPTRDKTQYQGTDGEWYDSLSEVRRANAKRAIRQICDGRGWQGSVTSEDVAQFVFEELTALAPWLDDLCA